jgi:hypothetical protein
MNTYRKLMDLSHSAAIRGLHGEWRDLEALAEFSCYAERPEELHQKGEETLTLGLHLRSVYLTEAGRLLKEEAQKWGEKRIEARRAREDADRRASKFSLGDLLRGAL